MVRTNSGNVESRESYWRRVLAEWSASGQTQVAFCRRRGLSLATLRWWKSELGRRGGRLRPGSRRSRPSATFVPVQIVAAPRPATAMFEVVLISGRTLRVPVDAEADAVARLASVLEG